MILQVVQYKSNMLPVLAVHLRSSLVAMLCFRLQALS
jgi:hypothetical protein